MMEIERWSTRPHSGEKSLRKRLWTCRSTDYEMIECWKSRKNLNAKEFKFGDFRLNLDIRFYTMSPYSVCPIIACELNIWQIKINNTNTGTEGAQILQRVVSQLLLSRKLKFAVPSPRLQHPKRKRRIGNL